MYSEYENKKLSLGIQGINGKVISKLSEKGLKRKLIMYSPELSSGKIIAGIKKLFESLLNETEICGFADCFKIRKKFYKLLEKKNVLVIEEDEKLANGFYYLTGEIVDYYFEITHYANV